LDLGCHVAGILVEDVASQTHLCRGIESPMEMRTQSYGTCSSCRFEIKVDLRNERGKISISRDKCGHAVLAGFLQLHLKKVKPSSYMIHISQILLQDYFA
jgi:hypothetical protein